MLRTKQIRWNHLHLKTPEDWQVIVKGNRHLILEHQLKPVLEMRWQPPDIRKSSIRLEKIARQLENQAIPSTSAGAVDRLSAELTGNFTLQLFTLHDDQAGPALLLNCRTCRTVVLLRLYQGATEHLLAHPFVLTSLNCHPAPEDTGLWQIQDFFLAVPTGFELDSCSFQFGVSRLLFKATSAELQFCRLAPAATHLERSSLAELFHSFCAAPPDRQIAADPCTLRYRQVPTLTQQILSRIKRGLPYQASVFSYFPDYDRILGYSVRSVRPLTGDIEADLYNGYGIIQEKETSESADS